METKEKREDRFNGIRNITGNVVLMIRILRSFLFLDFSLYLLSRFLSSKIFFRLLSGV